MIPFDRKPGEGFFIGRGVRVTILKVDTETGNVNVGVEAPKNIAVSRDDFSLESHLRRQIEREGNGE